MIKKVAEGAVSLFFPAQCKICKRSLEPLNRSFICRSCWSKVKWLMPPYCSRCSKPFTPLDVPGGPFSLLCEECRTEPALYKRLLVPTLYEGVMKEAIHLLKYERKKRIFLEIKKILKRYLEQNPLPFSELNEIIPIPLHRKKLKQRGFNQAYLLAHFISRFSNLKLVDKFLLRIRETQPQIKLSKQERMANLKDAFQVRNGTSFRGKTILLVDDVYTTGATLREAARLLRTFETREIYVLTLARAP